ncbi:rCG32407 [Rattus norvegicus]|uniref:RCG32407 n=1 Tax=Rattus norvegicus TaxID=10116 RepID=A6JXH1_RAT|nr:rCG32407 [Rattus norvegicus]
MGPGRPQQFCGREQHVLTSERVSGGLSLRKPRVLMLF